MNISETMAIFIYRYIYIYTIYKYNMSIYLCLLTACKTASTDNTTTRDHACFLELSLKISNNFARNVLKLLNIIALTKTICLE